MAKRIGLYPGTFDPLTLGHLDIIKRAVKLVDHLVIGVATNASKIPLFTLEERLAIVRHETAPLAGDGRATIDGGDLRHAAGQICREDRRRDDRARAARGVRFRI